MVWCGMSLRLVIPKWNQSSAVNIGLLKVLVALNLSEPIFRLISVKSFSIGTNQDAYTF